MLIGCCHCESESEPLVPSESEPPSESSVYAFSRTEDNCATGQCISEVFATNYRITFAYSQTAICGPTYSVGSYIVRWKAAFSGINRCLWRSDETAINRVNFDCNATPPNQPLITLYTVNDLLSLPSPEGGNKRYLVRLWAQEAGADRYIAYSSNLTNGVIGGPSSPIDCLSPFTLPLITSVFNRGLFERAITGVNSGGATIPLTVTVSPA